MATTTAVDTRKSGDVVVGIDTHKYVHVGAAFDTTAGLLSTISVPADSHGFVQLLSWAESFGQPVAFGIEGTRFLRWRVDLAHPTSRLPRHRSCPTGSTDTPTGRKIGHDRRPECGKSSDGRVRYRRTENRRRNGRDDSQTQSCT